jgi:acetyl-CoA carboxylase carboxyltransferase component
MANNREQWNVLLQQLESRQEQASQMGGPEKVAAHQAKGYLTARARLDYLFDADSFNEIGALAGMSHPAGHPPLAGDALVGGIGRVNGMSAVAMAEDFTTKGGSIGHANAAKRSRLVRLAAEQKLPLILMLEGAGERVGNNTERYPNVPNDLQLVADLKGHVPVITLVLGPSAGHGALTGMFADFIIMRQDAALFTAGPPLVALSLGVDVSAEELGGVRVHAYDSGVVHNVAATDQDAIDQAKQYLSFLGPRSAQASKNSNSEPTSDALLDIIPPQANTPYDMRSVIQTLLDRGDFFELQPFYGRAMILGLGRVADHAVMVMANQPMVLAGSIDTAAAQKAAHFIEVADQLGLPLISLIDNPGVLPGPQSEKAGILKAAGRMFYAQRRFRGKKIVVTLRKAYGFGSSVMGMNPWDRQTISLALPSVSLGGVPAIGSTAVAKLDAQESERIQKIESGAWVPADSMAFDKIVDPRDLRAELIAALEVGH